MAKGRESGMPEEAYWQTFFNPECIVARLDCAGAGDLVEFGCGYGHFTIAAAKLVSGNVYALDIDPNMVAATASRAVEAGLANVVAHERDFLADGCGRPDGSATYAMLFNILHVEDPVELLREAYRVLAPTANWASSIGRLTPPRRAVHRWPFARNRRNADCGPSKRAFISCATKTFRVARGTGAWC